MVVRKIPENSPIVMPGRARATHMYVVGQPETGKSRALESWIMQDILSGQGVGVIDPHGELFDHLLSRIAHLTDEHPELAERVVIVDPRHPIWTVGFNPLERIQGVPSERPANSLADVAIKIWKIDPTEAPRMTRLLTYSFLAASELGLTIAHLPRFLLDTYWRESLLNQVNHTGILSYFRYEFPKSVAAIQQWAGPVLNRIDQLVFDPDLRLTFSAPARIHFREILDRRLVLLVNLSKGHLAEANSAILGAFIVAQLQKAALAREGSTHRPMFFLYLDEFENFVTDNVQDILAESRKYHLSLILAHQFLDQLPQDLAAAVLNTAGTIISFRVGYHDASILAREIFPYGFMQHSETYWELLRVRGFPIPVPGRITWPMIHEEIASMLMQLPHREFVSKRRGPYVPVKQRTLDMPSPVMTDRLIEARERLRRISGERYGRLKWQVQKEQKHGPLQLPAINPRIITDYEET